LTEMLHLSKCMTHVKLEGGDYDNKQQNMIIHGLHHSSQNYVQRVSEKSFKYIISRTNYWKGWFFVSSYESFAFV